jgi:hypothetical protein
VSSHTPKFIESLKNQRGFFVTKLAELRHAPKDLSAASGDVLGHIQALAATLEQGIKEIDTILLAYGIKPDA